MHQINPQSFFSKSIFSLEALHYNSKTNPNIEEIDGKIYIRIGNEINKYFNGRYFPFLVIDNPNFGGQFYGRSENDIFFSMFDGIAHYNGYDIEYIYQFSKDVGIVYAYLFEDTVFFIARNYNDNLNLVFKGVLQSENN